MKNIVSLILFFLFVFLAATACWIVDKFGNVTTEQLLFHLYMPLDSDAKTIISFVRNTIFWAVGLTVLYAFVLKKIQSIKPNNFFVIHFSKLTYLFFGGCIVFSAVKLNVPNWFKDNFSSRSNFYETYYSDPSQVKLTFPDKKRNLVLIFVESFESTYSEKDGENLIPETTAAARIKGVNFSDADRLGGAEQVAGTSWTQAGLVAQTCGIPLRLPIDPAHYRMYTYFLPKAHCLYDVLKDNGYAEKFMIGTKSSFAGMDIFFKSHGDLKIEDYTYFTGKGGKVWDIASFKWGLKDSETYSLAKKELSELGKSDTPFAFGMMTMDTHFATGYFDDTVCKQKYPREDIYKNVISCADKQLSDFLAWLESQPFYKNTTVVVVGDHLAMNDVVFGKDKRRRVFNLFLNAQAKPVKTTNRKFTTMDIYPTILAAMGVEIAGDRLGLGTSLFSGKPTVLEQIGDTEKFNGDIMKRSAVYDYLLYGRKVDF